MVDSTTAVFRVGLFLAAVALAGPSSAQPVPAMHNVDLAEFSPRSLAECDRRVVLSPDDLLSYYCYQRLGLANSDLARPAIARLEALLGANPEAFGAKLHLGYLLWKLDREPRAEQLVREAADGFARTGQVNGEVYARTYLDTFRRLWGRAEEGIPEVRRAAELAQAAGDPLLLAYVRVFEGWHAIFELDFGRAGVLFDQSVEGARGGRNSWLLAEALEGQGMYLHSVGRLREAFEADRARVALLDENVFSQAEARSRLALYALEMAETHQLSGAEADRLIEEALQGARRAGAEVSWTRALRLHAMRQQDRAQAIAEMKQVLVRSRQYRDAFYVVCALRYLSMWMIDANPAHPEEPLRLATEATALSEASGLGTPSIARTAGWRRPMSY